MNSSHATNHGLRITADEINCLIYAYLLDSGFTHSAFAVKMEGQLDRSPYASKHIQRGELVELLGKSLLYLEVESHWKNDGLANNCKSGFSLLEPHTCSTVEHTSSQFIRANAASAISENVHMNSNPPKSNGPSFDAFPKRKESPTTVPDEGPAEKRAKHDPDDMDLDTPSDSRPKTAPPDVKFTNALPESTPKKPAPKQRVFVCGFNPVNHELLATGSKDAIVNLWTLPKPPEGPGNFATPVSPTSVDYFSKPEQGDLTSLDWNSDGTLVAIGSYDSTLRICTSGGALLDGTACLWNVKEKRLHKQYRSHTDCCLDVDWLDDETFATCGADQLIFIMSVNEAQPLKRLSGHGDEINQIKCNPSGTRLASCSDDMTARVWNVDNLHNNDSIPGLVASDAVVTLSGHKHSVSTIGWCPDPTIGPHPLLATSSFDGTARLWDSVTGKCLKVFNDHKRPVYTLSFSPNGRWLATGSGDGWLHVYNVISHEKKWSWFAGPDRPGVFEIDWQVVDGINRIALALECRLVAVIDVTKIAVLQDDETPQIDATKAMTIG
ncbi:hypothetical protein DXG01_009752 [Tephrocybe rancida]|nr:hypothetical protein DXG01_009752 [Tephrocybe rancida]